MHPLCHMDSDIADWLAIIHLESYQDIFKQHGYVLVRDVASLRKEDLQKLGITATGHCKRILNLVQQTYLFVDNKSGHMAEDSHSAECTYSPDRPVIKNEEISDSEVDHDLASQLQHSLLNKESTYCIEKPIPKPRTVFSYDHGTAKLQPVSLSILLPVHKPTFCSAQGAHNIQERFDQEKCTTNAQTFDITSEDHVHALASQRRAIENNSGTGIQNFVHINEMSTEGKRLSKTLSIPSIPKFSSLCSDQSMNISPTTSISTAQKIQAETVLVPSVLIQSASLENKKEMLPDATLPLPVKSVEMKESLRGVTSTEHFEIVLQNGNFSTEKTGSLEQLCLNSQHSSEGPLSYSNAVDDFISPYCESLFGHCWPTQGQNSATSECQDYGDVQKYITNQSKDPINPRREDKSPSAKRETGIVSCIAQNETEDYSTVEASAGFKSFNSSPFRLSDSTYSVENSDDLTISPYASYTSLSEQPLSVLSGWLDKLSPQGNYVFQRRFIRFDGKNLMYFNNEKEPYPKGLIPLCIIGMVRSIKDNKFQVITKHRIFVFRAESEAQRHEWCSTLQQKVTDRQNLCPPTCLNSSSTHFQKRGYLELKGYKSKLFVILILGETWLYKSEQFFKMGIAICLIEMHHSTIRDAKGRNFELITPCKIFSFGAESEREKQEWMEVLQNSIAEILYDYEVAEKIWSNKANRFCADCHALSPDWASINLCVVICKHCAGLHRSLGSRISKVQSLKLDTSIWSNEMVQLFIMLGNRQANKFWAAHLPASEALYPDANTEQRRDFIIYKYRYGRFRMPHPQYNSQESILQALCAAVSGPGLLKKMVHFFASTMEVEMEGSCFTWKTKPWSNSGHTHPSEGIYNEITQPVVHCGYLYKVPSTAKAIKRSRDEFQRIWCSLEKCFLFYETERSTEPTVKIEVADMISLAVNRTDMLAIPSSTDRFCFMLELYLNNERIQLWVGDDSSSLQSWASAIGKWFTPLSCHCLLGYEFQRVGRLYYKSMLNPNQWLQGFFILQKFHLFICPEEEGAVEDSINLRQLQELSIVPFAEGPEKKQMLILVEMGRTFCLQGTSQLDFSSWCTAIQSSAGSQGNALQDQQLNKNGIPIIVSSCISFITQYGLQHEGIYRKNGAKSRIKILMEEFRRDARNVKLHISNNFVEDVTDVLKRFFRELEDTIFTTHFHPQWNEAAEISQKSQRLERYKELINCLPHLNRRTLAALIGHLYRVQKCVSLNHMNTKNLALLFAPSLFQTNGKGEHEVKVMEDLIDNYVRIFNIDEDHVLQMDLENSLITTWRDVKLSQAGDIILEVYLEQKNPDYCVTLKVSPKMRAEELTNQVLKMRNVTASRDIWLTFEVLENEELERPLHPKEKVLEQALQWCKLPKPSSAYLIVKKVAIEEGSCLFTDTKRESPKYGLLKCREELAKLLGNKFQERYFVIKDQKLLLLKEKQSVKPEREWLLDMAKVYLGIRKKLKPPSRWGFTLILQKQQLSLTCTGQSELWDWVTSILKAQHDRIRPVHLRRCSSSDMTKPKFGTMPLISLHGDSSNPVMLSVNQTLHRLHTRRTLSMFFPMKMHHDTEQQELAESEPVYEEVGSFTDLDFLEPNHSLLPPVDKAKKPIHFSDQVTSSMLSPCQVPRVSGTDLTKPCCFERTFQLEPSKQNLTDRILGHKVIPTVSIEQQTELPQAQFALCKEEDQHTAVPTLHWENPTEVETLVSGYTKKNFQT
ncbi:arf-GAP with Rho-GAP domain, ANK repeat and PH domain-containing protein 3 [Protobothrops mucrosquamatus]|uniref:arf-GAP with Rho-GAP domain, ANK repeat and PH domain-containing protein 3 n=1 Tax=Protobothrops mucrosquamatus TaxID=103944 RepID=UPI0010FB9E60|nr:arf-GAP with Rho-GAP domain, ANK repeat and PH domain-containing protein 3 [Protobothrops mucrosquamatus]